MGQLCPYLSPAVSPAPIHSLCQSGAATQLCFMALMLAGGPMCHSKQLQGYNSMSPRCFYRNSLISPHEPYFLSPFWVSVSCWGFPPHRELHGVWLQVLLSNWSRCRIWARDFDGVVQHIKSNRACSPQGPPSGTPSLSSLGCCC